MFAAHSGLRITPKAGVSSYGNWYQMPSLPVSLASLYDKVNHTEPGVLRALVRGSAERLAPVMAPVGHGADSLPGWRLRVLDGNYLPASEKRLVPLREFRGAALTTYRFEAG